MRSSKKRSRSSQNRPRSLGNIVNRVFDSSGPEGKVRGTPQQIIEKYHGLARDAQLSNDRVAAENFQQHAEHYTRMLAEAQRELAAEQEARQLQNGYRENHRENGYRDGAPREHNHRDGAPRENGQRENTRDRYEPRGEYRQDRNENRGEQRQDQRRDYRSAENRPEYVALDNEFASSGAGSAEVIELHGDDTGLVDLPESLTSPSAMAAQPSAEQPVVVDVAVDASEEAAPQEHDRRNHRNAGRNNRDRGAQNGGRYQRNGRGAQGDEAVEAVAHAPEAAAVEPAAAPEAAPEAEGAKAARPRGRAPAARRPASGDEPSEAAAAAPRERRPRKPRTEAVAPAAASED